MKDSIAESIMKENSRGYEQIADKFSSTRQFPWQEFEFFKNYINPNDNVLDAGCGNGRLYKFLNNSGINYYGLDSSQNLINIAKSNYPQANLQTGDITTLPFSDNQFDTIFCVATLHHIPGAKLRQQVISEFHRVLKPNGHLIMTNWNLLNSKWWPVLIRFSLNKLIGKNKMDWGDVTKPWKDNYGTVQTERYLHAFSKRQIKKLLNNQFRIKKQFYTKRDANSNILVGFNLVTIAQNLENKGK
ncbi:MAG: class I SAM-dependent methyltransferase [bacterium]|nr:class I SAM-dependent methyltransferase [bacterium]